MFGSVFNPYPIQAAMGLADDVEAPPAHSRTYACFDQRQVPTHFVVAGALLERVIGEDGFGRATVFIEAMMEGLRRKYPDHGEFYGREWMRQEYCWNRWGANFGGRSDRMPALWEQIDPAPDGYRAFLAAGVAHYTNIYAEFQLPVTHRTWSVWYHSDHPWQGDFDPLKYDPNKDLGAETHTGYPLYATDELPAIPFRPRILQSPNVWEPMLLKGRNKATQGNQLLVEPYIL